MMCCKISVELDNYGQTKSMNNPPGKKSSENINSKSQYYSKIIVRPIHGMPPKTKHQI